MRRALAASLSLCLAAPAAARCSGDFNGNLSVEINELITAVNHALNGCPDVLPTPTVPPGGACPLTFTDDNSTSTGGECYFAGRWNAACGSDDLEAYWFGDGEVLIVEFLGFTPGLFYAATVTSPTTAELIGWYQEPDASDCIVPAPGTLTLTGAGGGLVLQSDTRSLRIEGCDLVAFNGLLTDVVGVTSGRRAAARAPSPQTFARIRLARDTPNLRRSAVPSGGVSSP